MVERQRTLQFVDKVGLRSLVAKVFDEMRIRGEPVGAEKVQEMIAVCKGRPEDNALSQAIIGMREE